MTINGKPAARLRGRARLLIAAVLILLAALTALAGWLVIGELTRQSGGRAVAQQAGGAPAPSEPWLRPAPEAVLSRIVVGSCLDQAKPQPIWKDVLAARPDLVVMVGDNVYGDIKSADGRELAAAYRLQAGQPEFAEVRRQLPVLAIWDDHDFGLNDGGGEFEHKALAADMFRAFWQLEDARPQGGGVYYSRTFGPPGRRVQLIMLDARTFRSGLRQKSAAFPHWGKYEPDPDPAKTMLGEAQWRWLAAELAKPADIRLIASGVQVLAEGHGFERWGNLPAERERLLATIRASSASGVILLSGDRHAGAIYRQHGAGGLALPELTASSLNRSYGPSKDTRMPPLVTEVHHQENFGVVDIDWQRGQVRLALKGLGGQDFAGVEIDFRQLGIRP